MKKKSIRYFVKTVFSWKALNSAKVIENSQVETDHLESLTKSNFYMENLFWHETNDIFISLWNYDRNIILSYLKQNEQLESLLGYHSEHQLELRATTTPP